MDWVAFHQPGGPLAFAYPRDWTIRGERNLELVSPSGSVMRWSAYRAPEDRGDEVALEQAGTGAWQLARRRVVVRVIYEPNDGAEDAEKEVVEAIVRSTRPAPGPPEEAAEFVREVVSQAAVSLPDRDISAEGMSLRLEGRTVLDLTPAYRDVAVHPESRTQRIDQVLAVLRAEDAPFATWDHAKEAVFPLLVPTDSASERLVVPFNDQLAIAFALDQGPMMRRVTPAHLADWAIDAEGLRDAALTNLQARTSFRGRTRPEHSLTVVGGHTFATAEVLLPRFRDALVPRLGESFLVALPSRDVVGAASHDDATQIRTFAQWAYAADAFPCCPSVFKCQEDGALVLVE